MRSRFVVAVVACGVMATEAASAQSRDRFQLGAQVVTPTSSQFDAADIGFGGRFSWHPAGSIGVEAEVDLYPDDFPGRRGFSRARVEGLFGATVGPTLDRVRPYARLRPGFLIFREASDAVICIAIYPPPLSCTLAAGRTLFALDVGGGVEVAAGRRAFVRIDLGDRLLRYPGPTLDNRRTARAGAFVSHDVRFAAGGGMRF